jgi:hypothetical protein
MLESSPGHRNRQDHLERTSRAWAAFGFGMLVVIALIAGWTLRQVSRSDGWVNHTYEVLSASQQVRARLGDAKIATHDYLASGDERDLARYRNAASDTLKSFGVLRGITADNESQQRRLDELQPLLTGELDDLAAMIAVRKIPRQAMRRRTPPLHWKACKQIESAHWCATLRRESISFCGDVPLNVTPNCCAGWAGRWARRFLR